jgi:hypothetical protein
VGGNSWNYRIPSNFPAGLLALAGRPGKAVSQMKTHQKSQTANGEQVTYGADRLAVWLEIDHGKGRRTAIYATPGWIDGLVHIQELIAKHGIKIMPQHAEMFSSKALTDAA